MPGRNELLQPPKSERPQEHLSPKEVVALIAQFRENTARRTAGWLKQYGSGPVPIEAVRDYLFKAEAEWNDVAYRAGGISPEERGRLLKEVGY